MQDERATAPTPRWLIIAFAVALVALLGWLGWRAGRAALYGRAALADLDRLQAALDDPSLDALGRVGTDLGSLETHLVEARAAAGPFLRLAPHLGWAPRFGPDLVAAPQLVDMAVELAAAGTIALEVLAPIADEVGGGGGLDALPAAVAALEASAPRLAEAREHMAAAAQLRATLPPPAEPRLVAQLDRLDPLLPLAADGLELVQLAPALLGAQGPATYLLLAQNNHELRATGGFISGAGHVTVDRGRIVEMVLADSYAADNFEQPHPAPPAPLTKYMAAELWLLRDSNWSPDFPEAAEVARALYAQDRGVATGGAVALDLEAVRLLVAALGPLSVPGVNEPVTGDNAIAWMKAAWQSPVGATAGPETGGGGEAWWEKRKDFMGELVKASLAALQGGADIDLAALARSLLAALEGRHLQISIDEPRVAAALAGRGWDGGVRPQAGEDFLLVVDSNVGFNKANLLVQTALDYAVIPAAGSPEIGGAEATLTITYTHTGRPGAEATCDRAPRYAETYDGLAQRCYWDFLRVYTAGGATLLSAEGLQDAVSEPGERGTTVISGDFVLRPGEQHIVTLRYRLGPGVAAAPYRLQVRKQAGTMAVPITIAAGACRAGETLATDVRFECPAIAP